MRTHDGESFQRAENPGWVFRTFHLEPRPDKLGLCFIFLVPHPFDLFAFVGRTF